MASFFKENCGFDAVGRVLCLVYRVDNSKYFTVFTSCCIAHEVRR